MHSSNFLWGKEQKKAGWLTDLNDVVHTALFHELGALAEGGVLHVVLP